MSGRSTSGSWTGARAAPKPANEPGPTTGQARRGAPAGGLPERTRSHRRSSSRCRPGALRPSGGSPTASPPLHRSGGKATSRQRAAGLSRGASPRSREIHRDGTRPHGDSPRRAHRPYAAGPRRPAPGWKTGQGPEPRDPSPYHPRPRWSSAQTRQALRPHFPAGQSHAWPTRRPARPAPGRANRAATPPRPRAPDAPAANRAARPSGVSHGAPTALISEGPAGAGTGQGPATGKAPGSPARTAALPPARFSTHHPPRDAVAPVRERLGHAHPRWTP